MWFLHAEGYENFTTCKSIYLKCTALNNFVMMRMILNGILQVGPSYSGGGRRGGRGGNSSFRGRGRGRGRGGPTHRPIPGAPPKQPAPPRQMAWCELCRVDCNSLDILESHREGKKHKKNLKMQEDLERINKIIVDRQNAKVGQPETGETEAENKQQDVSESSGSRGHGSKRRMRGGRGGNKWMRTSEGSKGSVEPSKSKPSAVPFVCELCHVTCESQVVFDSHLKGKKHMANLQHLQDQQTLLGQAALEALYPALQAILPALQGIYHPNPDASTSSSLPPEFQDPQAILTQLLTSLIPPRQVTGTLGQDPPNPEVSTSSFLAPQLQGGQDLQVVLTQLLASILASGQAAATPGAASTTAMGPPLVSENLNPENLPIQLDAETQEAEPAVGTEKKSEDLETKSEMDKDA